MGKKWDIIKEQLKVQREVQKRQNQEYGYALKHRKEIKQYFNWLYDRSIEVLKYIQDDFGQRVVIIKDRKGRRSRCKIEDELIDFRDKVMDLSLVLGQRKRYLKFRILHGYYPQILNKLKILSGNADEYKGIVFDDEHQKLEECAHHVKWYTDI